LGKKKSKYVFDLVWCIKQKRPGGVQGRTTQIAEFREQVHFLGSVLNQRIAKQGLY
jgi:hypothetical protein